MAILKIPTIEEFFNFKAKEKGWESFIHYLAYDTSGSEFDGNLIRSWSIEFAKLHVQEVLKTIYNSSLYDLTEWSGNPYTGEGSESLNENKINKIYPLENIK